MVLRFIACPSKVRFFLSVFNIIDTLCVLPMLTVYVLENTALHFWKAKRTMAIVIYLTLTSLLRVFRLFKLARHYIMGLAVRRSIKELLLLIILIFIGMLGFATVIYFAEFQQEDTSDIPISVSGGPSWSWQQWGMGTWYLGQVGGIWWEGCVPYVACWSVVFPSLSSPAILTTTTDMPCSEINSYSGTSSWATVNQVTSLSLPKTERLRK